MSSVLRLWKKNWASFSLIHLSVAWAISIFQVILLAQVELPVIGVYPNPVKQLLWWLTRNFGSIFTCSFSPCVSITLHLVWVFKHFDVHPPQCFIPFFKCFQFGETPNVFLPHFLLFNLYIFQRKLQLSVSVSLAPPFKVFFGGN